MCGGFWVSITVFSDPKSLLFRAHPKGGAKICIFWVQAQHQRRTKGAWGFHISFVCADRKPAMRICVLGLRYSREVYVHIQVFSSGVPYKFFLLPFLVAHPHASDKDLHLGVPVQKGRVLAQ